MAISCKSLATGTSEVHLFSERELLKNEEKEGESCSTSESSVQPTALHVNKEKRLSSSASEDAQVEWMISRLSPDEIDAAAMASYQYMKTPNMPERPVHAARIAKRYLKSKRKAEAALPKLQATLEFRRKMDVVGLIQAFQKDATGDYCTHLQQHLSTKKMYVQGYDKEGRSTLFFIPRLVQDHDPEWTLKEAVYSIERAIACSKSSDGLINAVVDFSGFSVTKHAPPLEIGKQFLTTLRNHYAGQIHRIFLLDTPSSFSLFWKIFKPFIGRGTRRKIQFLSGKSKANFQEFYDIDQAPSWMLRGGKKNRTLNIKEYLFETSFDRAFDEGQS